ncbi:MAG: tRNA pseudouridine(38-40) synthase TruA, partial [Terriglobia bacterium]
EGGERSEPGEGVGQHRPGVPPLRNLHLDITYDGTDFCGWQRQPGQDTIQGRIETALERITGERVNLTGSGRTDAGVHAAGQVANFKTSSPIPPDNLKRALNNALPETIRILRAREAPPEFHARYNAVAKLYRYRILQTELCPPYLARFVCHYPGRLDLGRIERAARWIDGEHDFTSFASAAGAPGEDNDEAGHIPSAARTVFHSRVVWNARIALLTYEVRGNGFLRHMVRTIAGTLIEAGRGAIKPDDIPAILKAKDRSKAGPTAPARGLCLVRVEY